jgi:hypothetical protein
VLGEEHGDERWELVLNAQNADFIKGSAKAFRTITGPLERNEKEK